MSSSYWDASLNLVSFKLERCCLKYLLTLFNGPSLLVLEPITWNHECTDAFVIVAKIPSRHCLTSSVSLFFYLVFFPGPLLVLIEYVPFGDLLGYLRKSRGLNDTYYKDPDIKPKTSLTSQQLMKFAWQIADGMSYLSSKRVRNVLSYWTFVCSALLMRVYCGFAFLEAFHSNGFHHVMLRRCRVVCKRT